ncbi:MAG: hypothetical protein WAK17_06475 [Candidatus Nitrosopolaris sp.]|jgi:hypothetical protein
MQTPLKFQIVITGFLLALLTVNILTTAVGIPVPLISAMTMTPGNHTSGGAGNMTFVGNMTGGKSMMMPGGNMTFGASLQNAKMHLMEAIMDLKTGNIKGAMMEMNLTDQGIKMHEQEIKSMMMEVKDMMAQMKGNATSSSSTMSRNATS